jgi:galactose mutarotase-like enzyme
MSPTVTLKNDRIQVDLAPEFGGRVTRLIDLASGRDWLVPGPCEGDTTNAATYGGAQARGWDECFPTVAPCEMSRRDHGDIWGRPVSCQTDANSVTMTYEGPNFRFERQVTLDGNRLLASYAAANTGIAPLPFMWSQHCLLNLNSDDRIEMVGVGPFAVAGALGQPTAIPTQFEWPRFDATRPDLSQVGAIDAGWAMKAYAPVSDTVRAWVEGPTGGISFAWSGAEISTLGLWLDYGGWPDTKPGHQVAIEPTTAPADDLNSAVDKKCERRIAPNETAEWTVVIALTQPENPQGEDK